MAKKPRKNFYDIYKHKRLIQSSKNIEVNDLIFTEDQMDFICSDFKETLFVGGVGSGKSLALCTKLVEQASIPGNVCILARKHLTTLKKSTLRMLLEPEGDRPPILKQNSYEHNKTERTIQLYGGGIILYLGCEDIMSIRSVNAGDIFIDEATQLDEQEYSELLMRLRVNTGSLRCYSATNPSNKAHFLYDRFVAHPYPDTMIIYASSLDNIYLPEEQREWLKTLTGDAYKIYVEGQWSNMEKIIYKNFSRRKHLTDTEYYHSTADRYVLSVDYGYSHKTALLLGSMDSNGTIAIHHEWCESGKLLQDILKQIEEWVEKYDPTIVLDPSAAGLRAECDAKGWNAQKANNDVQLGIDRIRNKLDNNTLFIDKQCDQLPWEIEQYSYGDDNKPLKIKDDAVDSLRYLVNYVADITGEMAVADRLGGNFLIF